MGGATALAWTYLLPASIDHYEIWRSLNASYFTPGSCSACALLGTASSQTYEDTPNSGVGDVASNYFYRVRAIKASGAVSAGSNPVGDFDFALTPGP